MAKKEYAQLLIVAIVGIIAVFSSLQSSMTGLPSHPIINSISPAPDLNFEERLEQIETSIDSLLEELANVKNDLLQLESGLSQLKTDKKELETQVAAKKQEALDAQARTIQLHTQARTMLTQLKTIKDRTVFANQLVMIKQAIAGFKKTKEEFNIQKREYLRLKTNLRKVSSQINKLTKKHETLNKRAIEISGTLENLNKQKEELKEILNLQTELDEGTEEENPEEDAEEEDNSEKV